MKNSISKHHYDQAVRSSMRSRSVLTIFVSLALVATSSASLLAQYNGSFGNIKPVAGLEWSKLVGQSPNHISDDGLSLLFSSTRAGHPSNSSAWDLYEATRASIDAPFDTVVRLDALRREGGGEESQTLSDDGLTTFFTTNWTTSGGTGSRFRIWSAERESLESPWQDPYLVDIQGSERVHGTPHLSKDGLTLYVSNGTQDFDLYKTERTSHSAPFGEPEPLAELNTSGKRQVGPYLSDDELTLFYHELTLNPARANIKIATRESTDVPFDNPVDLDDFGVGSELNSSANLTWFPVISPHWPADGSKLYFSNASCGQCSYEIYEATWNLFVDGDADVNGEVNFADFLILSENFGQAGDWREGDFDGDGQVGFPDFLALSENFGNASAAANTSATTVPEPTGLGVALIGLLGLIGFRKRR